MLTRKKINFNLHKKNVTCNERFCDELQLKLSQIRSKIMQKKNLFDRRL